MDELSDNQAHVWCVSLNSASAATVDQALRTLSEDERQRAARFVLPRARTQYVLTRGTLRKLLGRLCGTDPARLTFGYGQHGKPFLATPATGIQFNVSHAGEMAAYVVTRNRQVGIDIEQRRPVREIEHIAKEFFCPAEFNELMDLDPQFREAAFFNCWVRKEAYVKAIGGSLSVSFDAFRVSLLPGQLPALLDVRDNPLGSQRSAIHAICPAPDYFGAVAIKDVDCTPPDLASRADIFVDVCTAAGLS